MKTTVTAIAMVLLSSASALSAQNTGPGETAPTRLAGDVTIEVAPLSAPKSSTQVKPSVRWRSDTDPIVVRWWPCNCPVGRRHLLDDFTGIEPRLEAARRTLDDSHRFDAIRALSRW